MGDKLLKQRAITAIVLLGLTYLWLFLAPSIIFAFISWLICALALYELSQMYKFTRIWQFILLTVLSLQVALLYFSNYEFSGFIRITAIATWCFLVPTILIWQPKYFPKFVVAIIGLLLLIPAFYALITLHRIFGAWQLVSIMAVAWVADTGAYFVGRGMGRHKLAVLISPGKSIEGAIGGLLIVILYLLILKYFNLTIYLYSYTALLRFGIILTIASVIGDLFESWLKRVANVKDSGRILPGHGGILDRIDGLIAVLAVSFAMLYGFI